jgi:hypothetical protein
MSIFFHFRPLTHLFFFLVLTALPTLVHADHSWGGYHWARTTNPFSLRLGDNVSSAWDSILGTTSSDWSLSEVLDTAVVAGSTTAKRCRPTSGRVQVCNTTYGNNGWLGVAQIWVSGVHITQGTVKLNDTYFNTATYNTTAWRNLVSCQEVGHTLGLDHQDESFSNANLNTCMDYTNNPGTNQHPNSHDYDELASIYEHLDSTTTVSNITSLPAATINGGFETRAEWGKHLRTSHNGRESVYVRDFGGGHKVFTFVTWAQ